MAEEAKRGRGRPTDYTPELARQICLRIMRDESVRSICRDDDMPGASTVFEWLHDHPEFAEQYARARDVQAEMVFDDLVNIADGKGDSNQEDRPIGLDENTRVNRDRLRVDTRKWNLGRMKPRKYSERLQLAGDPEAPLTLAEVALKAAEKK